jgi:bifunctional DNA-binding transcriptional regulator/antitoxin component of YhaV-PrlF toxin-antitoxin module
MTFKLKVSSQNQVTLPVDLLNKLNLKPGMYLNIFEDGHNQDTFNIQNIESKMSKIQGSLGRKLRDKSKMFKTGEEFESALEKSKTDSFKNQKYD